MSVRSSAIPISGTMHWRDGRCSAALRQGSSDLVNLGRLSDKYAREVPTRAYGRICMLAQHFGNKIRTRSSTGPRQAAMPHHSDEAC